MTLYLIGIGLEDEKSISVRGKEIIKKCDKVYLENYTSLLNCSLGQLEKFHGKKIILADREMIEQEEEKILSEAKKKEVAVLVIGDVFGATTHTALFKGAMEKGVTVQVENNASILTAVGVTGLELYKFGKVASIPFSEKYAALEAPYKVLCDNLKLGLHTLFLLDLDPSNERFMTVNEAMEVLEKLDKKKLLKTVVGCARLGRGDYVVKKGSLKELKSFDFGSAPHCLIVPGRMHFMEEEMLDLWD